MVKLNMAKCECGSDAIIRTARTDNNRGWAYYACPRMVIDDNCNLYLILALVCANVMICLKLGTKEGIYFMGR